MNNNHKTFDNGEMSQWLIQQIVKLKQIKTHEDAFECLNYPLVIISNKVIHKNHDTDSNG